MTKHATHSLRRTLLTWLLWPLLLLTLVLAWGLYQWVLLNTRDAFDRALLGAALAIADRVVIENREVVVDLPYVALEMLSVTAKERVYYRIDHHDGRLITGYDNLPEATQRPWRSEPSDGQWFYDTSFIGQPVRVAVISRLALGGSGAQRFVVFVAETINTREGLATRSLWLFALGAVLLLLLVLGVLLVGLHRGLAPLRSFCAAISRRNAFDLHPLSPPASLELVPVAQAINQLLVRIERGQQAQQCFVQDASHQLRTPLAALKTQLALARQSPLDEAAQQQLQKAQTTLERSIRLTQQLLAHARAGDSGLWRILDLNHLSAELCREWVPNALALSMDLGYEAPETPCYLLGDRVLLREAIRNLIENALEQGDKGLQVTVCLSASEQGWWLDVIDTGPGIPAAHRERIFDRFFRAPEARGVGSGLGLAIVQRIAELHGGQIDLRDRAQGAHFRLSLPRANPGQAPSPE